MNMVMVKLACLFFILLAKLYFWSLNYFVSIVLVP